MVLCIDVSRRSLLLAVLSVLCIAAPALDLSARVSSGAGQVVADAAEDCWLVRPGTDVVVQVRAVQSALTTCRSVVRAGAQGEWIEATDVRPTRRVRPACTLTRGQATWAATAHVYGASDGQRVCHEMHDAAWAPR